MRVLSLHDAREIEYLEEGEAIGEAKTFACHPSGNLRNGHRKWHREYGLTSGRAERARNEIGRRPDLVDDIEGTMHHRRKSLDFPEPVANRMTPREKCWPEVVSEFPCPVGIDADHVDVIRGAIWRTVVKDMALAIDRFVVRRR